MGNTSDIYFRSQTKTLLTYSAKIIQMYSCVSKLPHAIMPRNIVLSHKSVASIDSDINQFQTKHNLEFRKINTLGTMTESVGSLVIIVLKADGLRKMGRFRFWYLWLKARYPNSSMSALV